MERPQPKTVDELFSLAPLALFELGRECMRLSDKHLDAKSQHAACYFLIFRSISLLRAETDLLKPETFDSWDVLNRAFMESRDLLVAFRIDDDVTRKLVSRWFKGDKSAWQPSYKKCETFLETTGAKNLQLSARWGIFSKLSHPTHDACRNTVAIIAGWYSGQGKDHLATTLEHKKADYVSSLATLLATAYYEGKGWVSLEFDPRRMPTAELFRLAAPSVVFSVLGEVPSFKGV